MLGSNSWDEARTVGINWATSLNPDLVYHRIVDLGKAGPHDKRGRNQVRLKIMRTGVRA